MSGFSASSFAQPPRHADFSNASPVVTVTTGSMPESKTEKMPDLQLVTDDSSNTKSVVLVRVDGSSVTGSNLSLDYTIAGSDQAQGDQYSYGGGTLYVASDAGLKLSGDNTIKLTISDGRAYTDGGAFNSSIEAKNLEISGGTTKVTATAVGIRSPSISGINVSATNSDGVLRVRDRASLIVHVETDAIGNPEDLLVKNTAADNGLEMQAEGIVTQEGAKVLTDTDTKLDVTVISNGNDDKFSAFANALSLGDGSILSGETIAVAKSNGGYAVGIDTDGDVTFGKTTVSVVSEKNHAVGIGPDVGTRGSATLNFGELSVETLSHLGESVAVDIPDQVTINFNGDTDLKASYQNEQSSADVWGMNISARGAAHFTGDTVTITAESNADRAPTYNEWAQLTNGMELFGPVQLTTAANTSMTVNAISTGKGTTTSLGNSPDNPDTPFAGYVVGLNAEGGKLTFGGKTNISAQGDGAYAIGMTLQAVAEDSDWVDYALKNGIDVDFNLNATFNGELTVAATSNTGGAEAISLGGYVPGDGEDLDYTLSDDVTVSLTTNGKTTITATTNSTEVESVGVMFDYPDDEGGDPIDTPEKFTNANGYLYLNGETTITADHAIKGDVGYITNTGTLVLNGRVDQYKGKFTQTSGSTVLNDQNGGFFGGEVKLDGGSITAADAKWTGTGSQKIIMNGGTLTLRSMTISSADSFELTGGKLSVTGESLVTDNESAFVVTKDVAIAAKGGDLSVSGGAKIDGSLTGLNSFEVVSGLEDDVQIKGLLGVTGDATVSQSTLDVVSDGTITVGGALTFKDEALLSLGEKVSEHVHAKSIVFKDGTAIYTPFTEADNQLTIKGWNATFNGTVDLWTGKAADGSEMDDEHVTLVEKLVADENTSLTFNGGIYSLKTIESRSGSVIFDGEDGQFNFEQLYVNGGSVSVDGGNVAVTEILFEDEADGMLSINGGALATYSKQIFTEEAGFNVYDPGSVENSRKVNFVSGTLVLKDAEYNQLYSDIASKLVGANDNFKLVFTGNLNESIEGQIDIGKLADSNSTVHAGVDALVSASGESATAAIDKSVGISSVVASEGVTNIDVVADKTITLVGSTDEEAKEVIAFANGTSETSVSVNGTIVLGTAGSTDQKGSLSTAVTVNKNGKLAVNGGTFTVSDVSVSEGGSIDVKGGNAKFEDLKVESGTVSIAENATTTIKNLALSGESKVDSSNETKVESITLGNGTITITGVLSTNELLKTENVTAITVNVGTTEGDSKAGKLTLSTQTLAGATFFIDPVYVDGNTIQDASSLKYAGATIDGNIIVGQNSYAVLGGTDESSLMDAIGSSKVSWGSGDGSTLAALYVSAPISVTTGSIMVDQTLTSSNRNDSPTVGRVTLAKNSVLVADFSSLTQDSNKLITANEVHVADTSKVVIVGDIKQGIDYMVTSSADANKVWITNGNIVSGNALWRLEGNEVNGTISATLQDAALIYGNDMQGALLANAGMIAGGQAYDYVNALLTDSSGNISALPSIAARFDAAMNPAGALSTFTTAYDRASDLRLAVREESVKSIGNRLWAHVTGSKTKLDGISSGGRAIKTDTKAYGLVVGGEVEIENSVLGAALTAGSGKTENDLVNGKDDFDYYGFSIYGKMNVAGVDLLGDVSATWLKSDITVGGVANVDTDTTTAVYSIGVQGEKSFETSLVDVTPYIGIDVYHVRSDGFSNGHGAAIKDSDATAIEIPIGVRLNKAIETTSGFRMVPALSLAVVPTIADKDINSTVKFAGAESNYNFTFADDVKIRSNLSLDAIKDNFSFGLKAGYEWGNEERSGLNLQLRARYMF